ncbi:MAG: protein-glutamate O-methyltransferase CheR [Desulfuromonadales bacterium]|nr:protein-glutamate O-methyltransferase CheR [Desulfuromonadales bacterium]
MAVATNVSGEDLTILPNLEPSTAAKPTRKSSVRFIGRDISDKSYQQIAAILLTEQQFNLAGYKNLCIKRRIAAQIRAVGSSNPEAYIKQLQTDRDEQEQLLAALSIHVSQFFRNPTMFKVLEQKILPELLQTAQQNRSKISIWSIGCANGEEPYSIALLCHKLQYQNELLTIIGTDLSPKALTRAEQGLYAAQRLSGVPAKLLHDYFSSSGKHYQLVDKIRQQVQFFRHDIVADHPYYRANLILCRNLLIYFSREQQQQILEDLAAALLPGGYLVLGRAETLAPSCRELFTCVDAAERIYQRVADKYKISTRRTTCALK